MQSEFALAEGQSAAIPGAALTLTFDSVTADERYPSERECAVSGPVIVSLTAPMLQTLTDYVGRTLEGPFDGIQDRIQIGSDLIRLKGVVLYPVKSFNEIKDAQYQVTLVVSQP